MASVTLSERYVLEDEIARGGMGVVHKARDEVLARPIAVKVLHPHLTDDAEFVERFRREALAAARLAHPNIVAIYDTGSERGPDGIERQYIVMEYCGGGTLGSIVAQGAQDPGRVADVGVTVCDALAYAHRHDIVHRDIKPANVLITDDGTLKVADFGIAKAAFVTGDLTTTGSILGTVTYLSPEQARGEEPGARSDIYALGVVLYELLIGRPPFSGETQIATAMMHIREAPPPPRSQRAGVPRPLEAVILKALEKDPDDRFASADEMGRALESLVGAPGSTAVIGPVETPVRPARRRRSEAAELPRSGSDVRWVWPLVAIVAAVVLLAIALPRLIGEPDPAAGGEGARGNNGAQGGGALAVVEVADFDPYGTGGGEHPEEAPLAADGKRNTQWTTEDYSSSLADIGKPGVGLVFDLGEQREVSSIAITGRLGAFEVMVSDRLGGSEQDFESVASEDGIDGDATIDLDEPATGSHFLVWITELPDTTGTASIAEVTFSDG